MIKGGGEMKVTGKRIGRKNQKDGLKK